MENEFVPYEQSLALKELGFDEECFGLCEETENGINVFWGNEVTIQYCLNIAKHEGRTYHCKSPLWQQAFDWFREKYKYSSYIKEAKKDTYRFYIEKFDEKFYNSEIFDSYEKAKLECLRNLIEITKCLK